MKDLTTEKNYQRAHLNIVQLLALSSSQTHFKML